MARKPKSSGLSIDFSGVEARVLVPEGDYKVKPTEVTKEDGNEFPYLAWTFEITDGKFAEKNLYTNTSLAPKALWNLRSLLEAMGIEVPDGVMELDLKGIISEAGEFFVTVEHEKYEGKPRPRIVDYFPADEEDEKKDDTPASKKKDSKPAGKGKTEEKEEEPDFSEMDKDELVEFIDAHDLDVDADDFPKLSKLRAAVEKAWEERDEDGGGDGEKYSEDAINEMGTKELQAIVDKHKLDVELEGTTKAKRRAVLKALKAEDLIEE
jgi:hypothetical protein